MAKMTKPDSAGRQNPGIQSSSSVATSLRHILPHDLVSEREAAQIIDVKEGTLAVWRSTGRYELPFIKVGRKVRYRRTDLDSWLANRTRANGATA